MREKPIPQACRRELEQIKDLKEVPVLVVEQNATTRQILEKLLLQWGMKPTTTKTIQEALSELRRSEGVRTPFRLALLDMATLARDGTDPAEVIGRAMDSAKMRLLLLCSADYRVGIDGFRQLGVAGCLTKPVKPSDLREYIHRTLAGSKSDSLGLLFDPVDHGEEETPWKSLPPLRILLAEDNLVNQKIAIILLEKQKHTVRVAANGKEAVAILEQEQPFDLVLMDVQMPEMDGLETTAAIRRREEGTGKHIPIIAMTANAMKGDRECCLAAGMDGYVCKPIRPQSLWSEISRLAIRPVSAGSNPTQEISALPVVELDPQMEDVLDQAELLDRLGVNGEAFHEIIAHVQEEIPQTAGRHDSGPRAGPGRRS